MIHFLDQCARNRSSILKDAFHRKGRTIVAILTAIRKRERECVEIPRERQRSRAIVLLFRSISKRENYSRACHHSAGYGAILNISQRWYRRSNERYAIHEDARATYTCRYRGI